MQKREQENNEKYQSILAGRVQGVFWGMRVYKGAQVVEKEDGENMGGEEGERYKGSSFAFRYELTSLCPLDYSGDGESWRGGKARRR